MQGKIHDIHDHIFDLTSYIMHGQITDHVYEVQKNLEGIFLMSWGNYNNNIYTREAISRVDCRESSATTYYSGQSYHVPKGVIHSTSNNGIFSITLIDRYNLDSSLKPRLVGPATETEGNIFDETKYNNSQAWELVDRAVSTIISS